MTGDGSRLAGTSPRALGMVVGGSLSKGLEVRLAEECPLEEVAVGRYVTIHGQRHRFFGLVTDVELRALHPGFAQTPPGPDDDFLRAVTAGAATYGVLHVVPYLVLDPLAAEGERLRPAKTVPPHFAPVWEASQEEVEMVFGRDDAGHFVIGTPLDMEVQVCLDYGRFIERSNGVFGKSGTGKTFLTYILLASIITKSNAQSDRSRKAVNLIFDMHNEYGWQGKSEGPYVPKGMKQLFPASVVVLTLDEESSRRRGAGVDGVVGIGYGEVEPEDIAILKETLNFTDLAVDACYSLEEVFGKEWIAKTLALDVKDEETKALLARLDIRAATLPNLRNGLRTIARYPFMRPDLPGEAVRHILNQLLAGKNVVLEFGRYGDDLAAYMLVANLLSRRIHQEYRRRTEEAAGDRAQQPPHLVIAIEEAHKFLAPAVAGQTIFGQIAREMRKYNVTLLVIDQRPAAIESEVMSQLGTKIACLLDHEADVDAVLAGVSGRGELRGVLSRLESRQQALIFGHALPMPVVVRTPDYGPESYARFREVGPTLRERLHGERQHDERLPDFYEQA